MPYYVILTSALPFYYPPRLNNCAKELFLQLFCDLFHLYSKLRIVTQRENVIAPTKIEVTALNKSKASAMEKFLSSQGEKL